MTATEKTSADLSACGTYRYTLTRTWGDAPPQVFIMLNPSTADATEDDATIRRCRNFAKREGAGGLVVVNLFGLRATNPKELDGHAAPVGADNWRAIDTAFLIAKRASRPIICAWGSNAMAENQAAKVWGRAYELDVPLVCFGKTKAGAPRHPLYVKADKPLEPLGVLGDG